MASSMMASPVMGLSWPSSSLQPSSSSSGNRVVASTRMRPLKSSIFNGGVAALKVSRIMVGHSTTIRCNGHGGGALGAQMNLFDRFARVIKSYANAIISSFEDPEKILEQAVLEMNDDLTKMRQATAQVLASQKQLENKYKAAQKASEDWYRRAQLALEKGEEDLAREALKRRKSYADNASALRAQLDQQKTVVDNLVSNTRLLESKIQEARSKKASHSSMEAATPKAALLSLFFTFLLSSGFAKPLQYQTLVLSPLTKPPSHNPDDLSWAESETAATISETGTDAHTVTFPLEHRDSLAFNQTPETLFTLRLQRDALRVKTLSDMAAAPAPAPAPVARNATRLRGRDFSSSIVSGLSQGSGEYFTRIGVGTPPKYSYMVLDTGSDIVWLQCSPCRKCYSQTDPVFDPTKSQSFSGLSCDSPLCRKLDVAGCNNRRSCLYQVSYGDGSFTVGEFSTETLTFRGTRVANVAFGCGHDNEGLFVGAAGLLGLGRGRLSFPSQTGRRFGRRFSYCLVDRTARNPRPSSIVFGGSAVPRSAVFTPMVSNPKLDTFYYLGITGISVGGASVRGITESLFRLDPTGNGGVIIDSGTSVSRLTRPAYVALRNAFRAGTSVLKRAPGFSLFDTCYDLSGKTEVKVPTIVIHFGGGADVSLPAANYLIPVNTNGVFCFAFAGTTSGLSIIGNIQQQGFRVVFDTAGSRIGFAPRGCA